MDVAGSGRIWPDLAGSGRIWLDVAGCGWIWPLAGTGWIWEEARRHERGGVDGRRDDERWLVARRTLPAGCLAGGGSTNAACGLPGWRGRDEKMNGWLEGAGREDERLAGGGGGRPDEKTNAATPGWRGRDKKTKWWVVAGCAACAASLAAAGREDV
ncbi:hypothetical protein ACLOJK_040641 [Asimina triloba]